jgi:hypothetical protein
MLLRRDALNWYYHLRRYCPPYDEFNSAFVFLIFANRSCIRMYVLVSGQTLQGGSMQRVLIYGMLAGIDVAGIDISSIQKGI